MRGGDRAREQSDKQHARRAEHSYFAKVTTTGPLPARHAVTEHLRGWSGLQNHFIRTKVLDQNSTFRFVTVRHRPLHSPGGQFTRFNPSTTRESGARRSVACAQTANYYFQGATVTARSVRSNCWGSTKLIVSGRRCGRPTTSMVAARESIGLQILTRLQRETANHGPRIRKLSALDAQRTRVSARVEPCQPNTLKTDALPPADSSPCETPQQRARTRHGR